MLDMTAKPVRLPYRSRLSNLLSSKRPTSSTPECLVYPTYYNLPHPDHLDGGKFTGFVLVKDGENLADIMASTR